MDEAAPDHEEGEEAPHGGDQVSKGALLRCQFCTSFALSLFCSLALSLPTPPCDMCRLSFANTNCTLSHTRFLSLSLSLLALSLYHTFSLSLLLVGALCDQSKAACNGAEERRCEARTLGERYHSSLLRTRHYLRGEERGRYRCRGTNFFLLLTYLLTYLLYLLLHLLTYLGDPTREGVEEGALFGR